MVRVLRHDRPPEECELTVIQGYAASEDDRQAELQAAYGDGRYLPQQNAYLCALPARLHRELMQLNAAAGLPQISADLPVHMFFAGWLYAVRDAVPSLTAAAAAVNSVLFLDLDKEWAECVRTAAEDRSRPLLLVTPAPPPVQELPRSVPDALSQGWESKYEDPLNVVRYLAATVDRYMAEWEKGTHFAAWTMVLQSSGWGKSRSIQELATKGFHVAYVSFLSRTATGIPQRSPVADLLASADAQDPRCIAAWVFAILSQIRGTEPQEWRAQQLEPTFAGKVSESYKGLKTDVMRVAKQFPGTGEQWQATQLREWMQEQLGVLRAGRKVVFCLDEAATLFKEEASSFVAFRRFFSAIPVDLKLFGLLADTAGKLGMVFPQKMFDPSARALDPSAKLFEPLWVVGSSRRDAHKLKHLMSQQQDITDVSKEFTKELFKMGRPLWRALLDNAALGDAVNFAMQKLLGGISVVKLSSGSAPITDAMATAIIGVAAGLEVAAWAELAQRMVAGHMRSVSHVSGDRERVFTADVIEPILGEAAARILADTQVLLQVLKIMNGVFKQAYVVEGQRGEIVGRLLLVLAIHSCCRLRKSRNDEASGSASGSASGTSPRFETYSHPVPLDSFLSQLCGRTVKAKGLVFFNRFMFLNRREISRELLLFCFLSGFAIIPQRTQPAYDVLVPWLMPGPDGKYELRVDRMRAVPVQIRNRQANTVKTDKLAECLATTRLILQAEKEYILSEHFCLEDRPSKKQRMVEKEEEIELGDLCGLYLHVRGRGEADQGDQGETDQVHITEDSKVLVLRGVRFPFLEELVSVELENMSCAFYNLEDELDVDLDRGRIVHNNFNNCFKLRKNSKEKDAEWEKDLLS